MNGNIQLVLEKLSTDKDADALIDKNADALIDKNASASIDQNLLLLDQCNDLNALHLRIISLEDYNKTLLKKIDDLETHLKKYTNGENHKRYYEKNKTKIKESGTLYLQKLKAENPDKLKEYSRNAYNKKKLNKKNEEEQAKLAQETAMYEGGGGQ
jgi:hypothetical protein